MARETFTTLRARLANYGQPLQGTVEALSILASGQNVDASPYALPVEGYNGQAALRFNAGFVGPGQTAKSAVGKQATSTTVTTSVPLWTVTAGKTLILTDIAIYCDATIQVEAQIRAAGVPIFRAPVRDLAPVQLPGIETQPNATSAQAVDLFLPITTGIQNFWFTITGVEQ